MGIKQAMTRVGRGMYRGIANDLGWFILSGLYGQTIISG